MTPRVSTILSSMYPDSLQWVDQACLDRGTRLHNQMESYFLSQLYGYEYHLPEDMAGDEKHCLRQMFQWCEEQHLVGVSMECEFTHKLGFKGHPDFDGLWNLFKWTLDWKFAESTTEMNEVQGEVYRQLTGNPVALIQCNRAGVITPHRLKPRPDLWGRFLSHLHHYKLEQAVLNRNAPALLEVLTCQTK